MGSLITQNSNSLSTIEDLSRFVLIGREKLNAVRAEIRAIEKVGFAKEVLSQKLSEAQDIADAVLDAEVRIGELMKAVPKASGGNHGNQYTGGKIDTAVDFGKNKSEVIKDAGFTQKQVERFQAIASHPEFVEQAKAEARENDDVVTRSAVLKLIENEKNKPHITNNSGNNEWYTPAEYIKLARDVLGDIDTDPASCDIANKTVNAKTYYTIETDGLKHHWYGRVWMNPPYSSDLIGNFIDKFIEELETGNITEGMVLVNNATETAWFTSLFQKSSAVCFPTTRIKFVTPNGESGAPLQGQALLYFGNKKKLFAKTFYDKGNLCTRYELHE